MALLFARSLIYQVVFYLNLAFWILLGLPTYAMPRWGVVWIAKNWGRTSIFWMRIVCGTKVEYRGMEKIPEGPLLVAAKHQSTWETFALLQFFRQPLYILKRELLLLPFFGWYLSKANMIGVNRGAGGRALIEVFKRARDEVRRGRQLIIFPEGTRMPVGAPPDYKSGVSQIYVTCGVTCIPVALNAGMFWPRRSFLRYPGTIVIEFLDPIAPGLSRDEFTKRVSADIETATARLVEDAREEQRRLLGFSATDIRPATA
ncbi:MAG: 1-acyl-sn-glycerol-3-phosphate acyltransferase [Bradyrhizobiaceae bacterium]|nr:MAG: 1-acyl-sn-glycerol-3-phosphate acyltransferase [Bradyrhizobiaceae bacterium]